jgi:hypothetical protein
MPETLDHVEPGDLITADDFNDLIDRLKALHERVERLERQQGGVVINGFDPPEEIEVGQSLAIVGTNFEFPPDQNTVEIDGRTIQEFLVGSTNTTLRLRVPDDIQVPQGGRNVTIRVENDAGSTQRVYRLLPASANQPSITSVTRVGSSSSNLIIGQAALIEGENFGSSREDNVIEFIATRPDGSQSVYPDSQDDLTVNSVSETEIEVVVPEIEEVPDLRGINVLLRISVDGLTAERDVNVRRQ